MEFGSAFEAGAEPSEGSLRGPLPVWAGPSSRLASSRGGFLLWRLNRPWGCVLGSRVQCENDSVDQRNHGEGRFHQDRCRREVCRHND